MNAPRPRILALTIALAALCGCTTSSTVQQAPGNSKTERVDVQLPEKYKVYLITEMRQLDRKMTALLPAMSAGEWDTIERTAKEIRDGYILKGKYSAAEEAELRSLLPKGFLKMDRELHDDADRLAKAAKRKSTDEVAELFFQMSLSCMECHAQYAPKRFPNFEIVD